MQKVLTDFWTVCIQTRRPVGDERWHPLSEGSFPDPCSCWEHSTSSSVTCPGPAGALVRWYRSWGERTERPCPPTLLLASHGFLPSSAHLPWPLLAWPPRFLPPGVTSILATDGHGARAKLLCRVRASLGLSAGWGDPQDLRSSQKRHFWNPLGGLPASRDQTLTRPPSRTASRVLGGERRAVLAVHGRPW